MTAQEKQLFEIFVTDDVYNNEIYYVFTMKSGDIFLVEYHGEGESEINPITGEDDYYYGLMFHIIKVIKNCSGNYCDDALIEISKYNYPVKIEKETDILTIKEIKELIKPIMEEYEINDYYLFGSYARSTATPESNVDIYCVKGKIKTFLDQMEFEDKLQKVLNKKVDIIFDTTKVDEIFEAEIKKDLIKL